MNDTPERWLPIPGYEGRYDVSDLGRVRSWVLYRGDPGPRILSPRIAKVNGYAAVTLSGGGKQTKINIHRLVMLAFVGPKPKGLETRHLDGHPAHNVLTNLAYGTKAQNAQDSLRHGTNVKAAMTHCARGHELTGDNIWTSTKRPGRWCQVCRGYKTHYKPRKAS